MKLIYLRCKIDSSMANSIQTQFEKKQEYIYDTPENYEQKVYDIFKSSQQKSICVAIMLYEEYANEIRKVWLGKCALEDASLRLIIEDAKLLDDEEFEKFLALSENASQNHIKLKNIHLQISAKDIPKDELFKIIYDFKPYKLNSKKSLEYKGGSYCVLKQDDISDYVRRIEEDLHRLAQRSEYARRPIGYLSPQAFRTEFQRDKERLLHSKAIRRIGDKAQVYNTSKGDHYRNRLTHTLEVSQISKGIARSLKLNEDLTEAIAIGHDLGHTPFGHEGERQLDLIMSGKIKLSNEHVPENFGGFKHNYQGIRIINYLEEKYAQHEGLDLTYQALEGIIKHTRVKKCKLKDRNCENCTCKCFDIDEFLILGDSKYLFLDTDVCSTLEGQVVSVADEIAQRGHDLDDGIASGVLSVYDLKKDIKMTQGMEELTEVINKGIEEIQSAKDRGRNFIDMSDLERAVLTPKILGYFIEKLIENSRKNMKAYSMKREDFEEQPIVDCEIIAFDAKTQDMLDKLEGIIKLKIINSQEVNCFDGKSAYTIKKLFKAYYENPRQLPDNIINRINRELKELGIEYADIRKDDKEKVGREINIYKGFNQGDKEEIAFIKQKIFMRNIADYIGGMTDEFANKQFNKLYMTNG